MQPQRLWVLNQNVSFRIMRGLNCSKYWILLVIQLVPCMDLCKCVCYDYNVYIICEYVCYIQILQLGGIAIKNPYDKY